METKVELQSVARRIGVRPKPLKQILSRYDVPAIETQPDGSSIYHLEAVVGALQALTDADRQRLAEGVIPSQKRFQGVLEGKFAALTPFIISSGDDTEVFPEKTEGYTYSTTLSSPVDLKYIATSLNISVRRAKEFMADSTLPTYPHPSQKKKVWELTDVEYKLKNLSRNEKLSIQVWAKQFNGGAHMHDSALAKHFGVEPELIPSLKHHYHLSRSYPLTKEMADEVKKNPDFQESIKRIRSHQLTKPASKESVFISQSELAKRNSLSLTEVRRLVDSGVIPKEPNGRILRQVAENLNKSALKTTLSNGSYLNLVQAGDLLHVSAAVIKKLTEKLDIRPTNGYRGMHGNWIPTYLKEDILRLKSTPQYKQSLELSQKRAQNVDVRREQAENLKKEIYDRVTVNVRERNQRPESTILYVGPTNSGKTYTSLNNLFEEFETNRTGKYVYAGPLRMLAYEVYLKMVDRYGEAYCGFVTGEESINPDAPLIACTVEMAPNEGDSLVLDETHWIVEPSRGQNWTNLLIGGRYRNLHVLTAAEAAETVKKLTSDSLRTEVRTYTRKTPLVYKGLIRVSDVPNRTAVVCFSRKAVYAVAYELEKTGKKVGVLYGALPLPVRKAQIQKYVDGEYDIMVTTDVIGHGINLPIDNVVFAQTEKFDGIEQRPLHIWEAAQIAGRAGRYGLSNEGQVFLLDGLDWFSKDQQLVRDAAAAGAGLIPTDLHVEKGVISPKLADLNITKQTEILTAMEAWETKATHLLADRPIIPSTLDDRKRLLRFMAEHMNSPMYPWVGGNKTAWRISTEIVWQLISGPFDPKGEAFPEIVDWISRNDPENSSALQNYLWQLNQLIDETSDREIERTGETEDIVDVLEKTVHCIGELKMTYLMFKHAGTLSYAEILETEDRFNEAIITALHRSISSGIYGRCENCGEACSPWFRYCEDCFNQLHSYWNNY